MSRNVCCFASALALLTTLAFLCAPSARAEGSLLGIELDTSQALRGTTDIHVDVLDFTVETFEWRGKGSVDVYDPAGTMIGNFASGVMITPTMNGAYRMDLLEDQFDSDVSGGIIRSTIVPWGATVFVSGVARPGRVWSFVWAFNTGAFDRAASTNASFYAKVPGGDAESFAVMELRTDGLAGFIFEIQGNSTGVRGPNAGRSVPEVGNSAANEYAMYLNPPDNASYTYLAPTVSDFRFRGGLETSGGIDTCDEFVAGPPASMSEFSFTSNVDGSFHIVCDLNRDGAFDIVDDGDFLILGHATTGMNRVPFNGVDNAGVPFSLGDHQCRVRVTVGEFHYVGRDIETSFLGLRMFQVRRDASRTPLDMFWNDALVQIREVTMPAPFAFISAETSGPTGLNAGPPTDPTVPLGQTVIRPGANSRAWGDFVSVGGAGSGKGNESYLDTYTWLDEALSTVITIHSVDGTTDTDGEGLTDYVERCTTGTDPDNRDTDGDSVNDFVETRMGMPGINTDLDAFIDALDPDDDGDCVPTRAEDPDGNGDPTNDNTDGDTPSVVNYLDADDDGDGLPTCMEDPDGDGDPTNDDADGDGIPNYLEIDSDGDCVFRPMAPGIMCGDGEDACPFVPESPLVPGTVNGFEDTDGCPEPDRDMDTIPDGADNCPDNPNTDQANLDGPMTLRTDMCAVPLVIARDMLGDECDDDDDGDGLPDRCEAPTTGTCAPDCLALCTAPGCTGCADSDPRDADSDHGCRPDGEEVARGGDPLDPIDDPLPGLVTGGSFFKCGAVPGNSRGPWTLIALVLVIALVRRRRTGR